MCLADLGRLCASGAKVTSFSSQISSSSEPASSNWWIFSLQRASNNAIFAWGKHTHTRGTHTYKSTVYIYSTCTYKLGLDPAEQKPLSSVTDTDMYTPPVSEHSFTTRPIQSHLNGNNFKAFTHQVRFTKYFLELLFLSWVHSAEREYYVAKKGRKNTFLWIFTSEYSAFSCGLFITSPACKGLYAKIRKMFFPHQSTLKTIMIK